MLRYLYLIPQGTDIHTFMLNKKKENITKFNDESLIAEYCDGQHAAFEILYQRHSDPLYRFILRQCNHHISQTEEIFQDIWMNVIKNSQQFRAESKFSTYLYQIARNKIIDHARKSISHHEADHSNESDILEAAQNHRPDHKAQLDICIELLQQCIQRLPDDQREAFVLKQESEHSLSELAQITQTTLETVKSRLRYAMKKLREWLPGECL